jgi:hypothetical protein
MRSKITKFLFFSCAFFLLLVPNNPAKAQENAVNSSGSVGIISAPEASDNRIAPGEFLPISVKLVNFGSVGRIDVTVDYEIFDGSNKDIYSESETVAVDTTASFVKRIQIPYGIKSGMYNIVATLEYPYQQQPAISKFPFEVENKIGGVFESDLILYCAMIILVVLVISGLFSFFLGWNQRHRFAGHDYSDKPRNQIIYYEILNDIISQMRFRIGDDALEIAKSIPDLEINGQNGLIINIKKDPAKIIASLVSKYEKISGHKISFGIKHKQ